MASNPPGPCCFTGFKHEGTPTGEMKTAGNIRTYFAIPSSTSTSKNSKTAIILLTDIFGISTNSQLLADDFASNGYLTLVPDLFNNDHIDFGDFEKGNVDIGAWISKHGDDVTDKIVEEVIQYVRSGSIPGIEKIAGAGYCFGGKYVTRFLRNGKFDTGYSGHPSFVSDEELAAIEKPFSISAAEIDDIFTTEARHKSEEILKKTGQLWQINLFSGVPHGFGIRGDMSNPQVKYAKEQAFLQSLAWFDYTL